MPCARTYVAMASFAEWRRAANARSEGVQQALAQADQALAQAMGHELPVARRFALLRQGCNQRYDALIASGVPVADVLADIAERTRGFDFDDAPRALANAPAGARAVTKARAKAQPKSKATSLAKAAGVAKSKATPLANVAVVAKSKAKAKAQPKPKGNALLKTKSTALAKSTGNGMAKSKSIALAKSKSIALAKARASARA